jgi:hypothetical protein
MATVASNECTEQIGSTAGEVWHCLADHGPMTLGKLTKSVGTSRDVVMQAVGWLAREGKLEMADTSRGRVVSLRESS